MTLLGGLRPFDVYEMEAHGCWLAFFFFYLGTDNFDGQFAPYFTSWIGDILGPFDL